MAGARPIVDPPVVSPLPFGLWDAVQTGSSPDHWQQGITWIERCPVADTTFDECVSVTGVGGPPPAPPTKVDNVVQTFRGATPFTVFAEFDCSPVGSVPEIEQAAVEALARIENVQVSSAFWTGVAGGQPVVFPHLAADAEVVDDQGIVLQTEATVCTSAAADAAEALGLLETCLAECYGNVGVIYVSPVLLPTLVAWDLVVERDGGLWTVLGNRVVVGPGFPQPSTGPDGAGAAAGTAWMYATGQLFGYRSPNVFATRLPESFDRAENTVKMLAERTYVLGFECCLFAALVSLGVPS